MLCDTREPKEIVPLLQELGIPASFQTLDVSDYQCRDKFGDLVLVTRKASDLYDSVYSGHFQEELSGCITLIKSYGKGRLFWLQEGLWHPNRDSMGDVCMAHGGRINHAAPSSFAGMQVSAQSAGLMLIFTSDLNTTAIALAQIYTRAQEGWPSKLTLGLKRPDLKWTSDTRVSRLMAMWPRLHEDVAVRLLQQYGSIRGVWDAARSEQIVGHGAKAKHVSLLQAEGVGTKGLENFKEAMET
jgi:ERCC4-type nuclease